MDSGRFFSGSSLLVRESESFLVSRASTAVAMDEALVEAMML